MVASKQHIKRYSSGRLPGFGAWGVSTPYSVGRRPAACSGLLQGCCAWEPAGFDDNIFCILWAAVRQQAPADCRAAARGELTCLDNTIFCTLWAAVWQPASAGCRAAARGGFAGSDHTMFCHLRAAVRQSALAGSWRVYPHYLALPPTSNRITTSHSCTQPILLAQHLHC
jgi:hypothetical protein